MQQRQTIPLPADISPFQSILSQFGAMWGLGKAQPTSLDEAVGGHQGRSERRDVQSNERDDEERVAVLHSNVHEACALDLVRCAVNRVDE